MYTHLICQKNLAVDLLLAETPVTQWEPLFCIYLFVMITSTTPGHRRTLSPDHLTDFNRNKAKTFTLCLVSSFSRAPSMRHELYVITFIKSLFYSIVINSIVYAKATYPSLCRTACPVVSTVFKLRSHSISNWQFVLEALLSEEPFLSEIVGCNNLMDFFLQYLF